MKIKFKDSSEIDFTKIFPEIEPEDYALLENQSLSIDDKGYEKMLANKYLDLAGYQISTDFIEVDNGTGVSNTQSTIQAKVDQKFIYADKVVDVLLAGIENEKNVMLWGKGGHGKSEITELVLSELHAMGELASKPFIQAFGDGLTEEKLFGGMDIKKYKEQGVIEYLLDNSFLNHEVVVFEEIFDAPPPVLLMLKDVMTSGYYRNGNIQYKCKTKVFIGLTNRSKTDFAEKNESLKALAERFVLTHKVEWDQYRSKDFTMLFKKVYGDIYYMKNREQLITLSNILEMNNVDGMSFASPRTAVSAGTLFCKGKSLEFISEIDPEIIKKYTSQIKEDAANALQQNLLNNIENYIKTHNLEFLDESEDFLKDLVSVEKEISGKTVDLSDLDFGSHNDMSVKLNRCKYIMSIIDRQSPARSMVNHFGTMKKRLNGIVQSINDSDMTAVKSQSNQEEDTGSNLPF